MFPPRFLRYTFTILVFVYDCTAQNGTNYEIVPYEFGAHVPGEELSFAEKGFIPPFVPLYTFNVTHSRSDLEQRYTFLRVEYLSPMSSVNVVYEPDEAIIKFHVVFPFMNIPFAVIGYSVKIRHRNQNRN